MQRMSSEMIAYYKENFPAGTRIQLESMSEDPQPVESGAKGTVIRVDDMGPYIVSLIMEGVSVFAQMRINSIKLINRRLVCQVIKHLYSLVLNGLHFTGKITL